MIIWFSGTGNSKYIAELLSKQLSDTSVDGTKMIRADECRDFESEKPYIFVAPVYAWRFPRVFREWIKKCKFSKSKKAYFVLTCGSDIGAAGDYIEKFASEMQFEYMGCAKVEMPDNYIVMFSAPPEAKCEKMIAEAEEKIAVIGKRISAEEKLDKVKVTFVGRLCSGIVNDCFYKYYISAKKFYSTDKCISCGKCAESCMLQNITMIDGRPKWGESCTHCMACISKCPAEAIEYGKHTKGLRRYVCSKV